MNSTARLATDGQIKFVADMLREIADLDGTNFAKVRFELYQSMHKEGTFTFDVASSAIDELKELRAGLRKVKRTSDVPAQRSGLHVPEGYYAVKNADDDWAFYRVSARGYINVFRSDDEIRMTREVAFGIKRKILDMGLEESQTAFGVHSTFCYRCGHRLTDEVSRDLGIGPICRSRQG